MTGQPTLSFDTPEQVSEAIEAGVRTSEAHADQEWRDAALTIIQYTSGLGRWFTSDDITAELERLGFRTETSALGPVMQQAARMGVIAKVPGQLRQSRRSRTHRSLTVWSAAS